MGGPLMHAMAAPTVVPDRLTEAWRDGIARGEFLLQRGVACGAYQYYPREHCTTDPGDALEWVPASGRGVVHTFTVVRRTPNEAFQDQLPYVLGIVELEEGVRVTARIVAPEIARIACGMPVSVHFGPDRESLPYFVPDETGPLSS
ncbi:Zn-ribbon domain-containing OB-fold protein [Leucobacter allii]|uniref:Zn-ribbon domain-containing OB-fold protein n=1 Tax=Leucobacter allii TaxID=2932247 RepID=UPI001FD15B05|nr:Zn-ribbon domain-containing OB-fold protein [Leucobacter allii]UOR01160.1 Zn-ribbon domain-containing OB-fold protein [Leucobacter allii]